jgi:BlaI family penicillinase repressor
MIDLSKSEKEVMSVIFTKEEEMRLKDIVDAVNQKFEHSWKPQTVSTFLARMIKKNYLTTYRKGRYTFYTPAQKHELLIENELKDLAKRWFEGETEKLKEFVVKHL